MCIRDSPNTVQRAFAELEREGFIRTERAVGRYVADNQKLIDDCKNQLVKEDVHQFVERMKMLGISKACLLYTSLSTNPLKCIPCISC